MVGYELSWVRVVLGTSCLGYELFWARVVLGTSCPGYELSWVRVVHQIGIWTTPTQDNSYPGQLVPRTTRTQDNSLHRERDKIFPQCYGWLYQLFHYSDDIISAMVFQIIGVLIVYSTVCSGVDQRKHRSSASLVFVGRIHRWPVNWPARRTINAENVSIWSRHHGFLALNAFLTVTSCVRRFVAIE